MRTRINSATITASITLTVVECGECGVTFAMSDDFIDERKQDHRTWYCPNGHPRHYPAKSEAEKLREQLATANGNLKWAYERAERFKQDAIDQANKTRAQKAAKTRILNCAKAGICSFCHRHFEALERHMQTKHKNTPEPNE